ncbi:MAG: DUF3343 domain-containing protein [Deltaproteobacteria bacterium]|nr:DUF3343 domain-containing protein [Deltaproteobacteria bacterium]
MSYGVVLFHTTYGALRAEKLLAGAGFQVKLIPPPREFSSDCGVSLRIEWDQVEKVKTALLPISREVVDIREAPNLH